MYLEKKKVDDDLDSKASSHVGPVKFWGKVVPFETLAVVQSRAIRMMIQLLSRIDAVEKAITDCLGSGKACDSYTDLSSNGPSVAFAKLNADLVAHYEVLAQSVVSGEAIGVDFSVDPPDDECCDGVDTVKGFVIRVITKRIQQLGIYPSTYLKDFVERTEPHVGKGNPNSKDFVMCGNASYRSLLHTALHDPYIKATAASDPVIHKAFNHIRHWKCVASGHV